MDGRRLATRAARAAKSSGALLAVASPPPSRAPLALVPQSALERARAAVDLATTPLPTPTPSARRASLSPPPIHAEDEGWEDMRTLRPRKPSVPRPDEPDGATTVFFFPHNSSASF